MKNTACRKVFCTVGLLLGAALSMAREFSLDAEFRPRGEFRSGYKAPLSKTDDPAFVIFERIRLGASYKSQLINARITVQDARVFGQETQQQVPTGTKLDAPATTLYEGWAELVFPKGFAFRIGRQQLKYDDQRLLSASNWSNTGNAFDLALLLYKNKDFQANLGYAYNNNQKDPLAGNYEYGTSFYKTMGFLWLSQRIEDSGLKITAIGIAEGFQTTETREGEIREDGTREEIKEYKNHYRFTYGGNIDFGKTGFPLSLHATIYGQSGKTKKGDQTLSSYLMALKAGYVIVPSFNICLGADLYSGTGSAAKDNHTFQALYGSNHAFNGAMDYWCMNTLPKGGLLNLTATATYKIKKVSICASFHHFNLQKDMGYREKNLGQELDLDITYRFCSFAVIQGGWSTYFSSDITNAVRGVTGFGGTATSATPTRFKQWAYLSLCITPTLFTYKKK